jgi:hypothetical protein
MKPEDVVKALSAGVISLSEARGYLGMTGKSSQVTWGRVDRSGPGVLADVDIRPQLHTPGRRTELIVEGKIVGYLLPTGSAGCNAALYQDFPWEKVEILTEAVLGQGGIVIRPANSKSPSSTMLLGTSTLYCSSCRRVTSFNVWQMVEASQVGRANPEHTYLVTCTSQRRDAKGQPLAMPCRWKPTSRLQIAVAIERARESARAELKEREAK